MHIYGRTQLYQGYCNYGWTANQCQSLISFFLFESSAPMALLWLDEAQIRRGPGRDLMVCAWHACCYDRATWYGGADRGKLMADGHPFNPDALTAASWDYPLGSSLRIVYGKKSVRVEVTDRGGKRAFLQFGKVVDLSHAAFARLEKPEVGSIRVTIRRED